MGSLTNQILNSIQKLGCDCSAICKSCEHFSIPASENPCKGCKYGSLGGSNDNYSKKQTSRSNLVIKVSPKKDDKKPPTDTEEMDKSFGGSGNVSNTPPMVTEKRAFDSKALLKVLIKSLRI